MSATWMTRSGHYSKTRREIDDGRYSIAMPVRAGGHVLACVNLTWRRRALTLTEVVQRYAGDLRAAVTTIESRLADAGVGPACDGSPPRREPRG